MKRRKEKLDQFSAMVLIVLLTCWTKAACIVFAPVDIVCFRGGIHFF